jgi:hypothetical protein
MAIISTLFVRLV